MCKSCCTTSLSSTLTPRSMTGFMCMPQHHPQTGLVEEPHANDVLLGRGVVCNNHPGNKKFRALVAMNKELYMSSHKRRKASIARSIVAAVRSMNPPGRFLVKSQKSGYFIDVGDAKAIEKSFQALRDGAGPVKQEDLSVSSSMLDLLQEHEEGSEADIKEIEPKEKDLVRSSSTSDVVSSNDVVVKKTESSLTQSGPVDYCPGEISSTTPSPKKKRKIRKFNRSISMPVTRLDHIQYFPGQQHPHAYAMSHMPMSISMHQSASTGYLVSSPTMPLWQVQQTPMPMPHAPLGMYHHHHPGMSQQFVQSPGLAMMMSADAQSSHFTKGIMSMPPPHMMQMTHPPPSVNANITYLPVLQYQHSMPVYPFATTSPCQQGCACHLGGGHVVAVSSTPYAEEIDSKSDTDDDDEMDDDNEVDDEDELCQRLEGSQSRLVKDRNFYSPLRGSSSSPRKARKLSDAKSDEGYANTVAIDLCEDDDGDDEVDGSEPEEPERQVSCWSDMIVNTESGAEECTAPPIAPSESNEPVGLTELDCEGINAESFEQFLRECSAEMFDKLDA